ncbi:MAG TPA: 4Fe-4S binding protein, partial [Deltaproteobacteria bacterium]|nr:4Fe-4S binding protein [Deltaproteobacteria bacterium]
MARSSYAKFATHISYVGGLFVGPVPEKSVWTKILRKLISEEECELGMHLTKTPISAEDFARKVGKPEKQVADMLWNMADHGTIFAHFVHGKPYYRMAPFIPGVYEYLMDYRTMDKEMAELFVQATDEMAWLVRNLSPIDGGLMKIVPVRQEVIAQPKILSHEDVMTFVNSTDRYSVADCACRYANKLLGKGCEHPIESTCLQFGEHAEYYEKTGRGRRITREECIAILNKTEEAGLVHTVFATDGLNQSSYICNCCGCSCSGFRVTRQFSGGAFCASNFRATIDDEKCVACGGCVEICPMNAIKLGDGLCKAKEAQIEKYETSWDTLWTKDRQDPHYRVR